MFDITKLILRIPNFLTHEECDSLINEYEHRQIEACLETSRNYNTDKIEDSSFEVVELNPNTFNFNLIRDKTKKIVKEYINYLDQPKYFFTKLLKESLKFSHSYRVMKYKEGSSIFPHTDHGLGIYGSVTFNLNDDYTGGEFSFFNGKHSITLGKGEAIIFPADYFWVHEVAPITKGTRYSLNSFLLKYPYQVQSQLSYVATGLSQYYERHIPSEAVLGPYN